VARKDQFLDKWLYANTRGEMPKSRYAVAESKVDEWDAVEFAGGLAWLRMGQTVRELTRLQMPATYYNALGWQNDVENKIHLVQGFTRKKDVGLIREIAEHTGVVRGG